MTLAKIKFATLVAIILMLNLVLTAQKDGNQLFDNSFLHQIKIQSNSIPNLWDAITRDYVLVNVTIDGNNVDSVGIKLKGSTSAHDEQKPLEIDLNEYVSGKKYNGLKKFELHNNYMDSYLQRESLAYELYRRAGLPSPRTAYAEVYVNNVFRGVYSITETIDKTFLNHNFPSSGGSLYKGVFGDRGFSVELKEGTMAEFDNFKSNLQATTLEDYVNLEDYLKQLATDIIVGDWDSYAYYRHNFYIYYETKSERLNFINWDHNNAFRAKPKENDLYPVGTFPAFNNLIENPLLRPKYEQTLCELLSYLIDTNYISNFVTNNYSIISSNAHGIVAADPAPLIAYITERKQRFTETLIDSGVACTEISYPLQRGNLVINEFVASTDSLHGIFQVDGGAPDWIELYNNTSSDIALDKYYYLSDDKNFAKKWNFPEEVTIPGNGFLIIWADNNIHEPGIHAGFKIDKDGGDLLMTYEDLTEIQNIGYKKQRVNVAYARLPNGIGDFVNQSPTYNTYNNTVVTLDDLQDSEVFLYLNPNIEYISIRSKRPVTYIAISDLAGNEVKKVIKPIFPLSLKELNLGEYLLRIEIGDQSYTSKIGKY